MKATVQAMGYLCDSADQNLAPRGTSTVHHFVKPSKCKDYNNSKILP